MLAVNGREFRFEGHAIVSADDRITDASGLTPPGLRIEADWRRFQAALDRSAVVVLGRLGHEVNPNRMGRNRLVLSAAAHGVERRNDTWWWNPAEAPLTDALRTAAPGGGLVAVPGGMRVFDLFLSVGYDAFHLTRVADVRVPDGTPLFSTISPNYTADDVLAAHGLRPGAPEPLAPGARLTIWRPAATA
jgi:hypothetical protein